MVFLDSFFCKCIFIVAGEIYIYYDLKVVEVNGLIGVLCLFVLFKVLFENLFCFEDGKIVIKVDIEVMVEWLMIKKFIYEIVYCLVCVVM